MLPAYNFVCLLLARVTSLIEIGRLEIKQLLADQCLCLTK